MGIMNSTNNNANINKKLFSSTGNPKFNSKKDSNGKYIILENDKKNQLGPLNISNDDAEKMCIEKGYMIFQKTSTNTIYLKAPIETYTDDEVIRIMFNEEQNSEACRNSICYFVGHKK